MTALELIEQNKQQKATSLDLGRCGLIEVPEALRELIWLEKLILKDSWWAFENDEWKEQFSSNEGPPNDLKALPSWLGELGALQELRISSPVITSLQLLKGLTNLRILDCSGTQVSDLSLVAEFKQLQELDCSETQVSDLSPITELKQLKFIDCSSTQISNLSAISELKQLKLLCCHSTPISDLSSIAELKQLQKLHCGNTRISDLSPIIEFNQLQQLDCGSTQITDLSPIAALDQLQELNCSETQISDLSPIADLDQLKEFHCSNTQIRDLGPISTLKGLQELDCSSTQISDLEPIREFQQLKLLSCYSTQVSDLSAIAALKQLQELNCHSTQISDLRPLANLKQLQKLYCGNTLISDLRPIADINQLQELYCSKTQISDLSPIAELKHLQELNCSETQITDLSSISELKQLKKLYCWKTQISDLSPIAELKHLQELNCLETQITDLSSISELKQLEKLYCWNTQISDLSPIAELKQLQELHCSSTQISDLGPISELSQLKQLDCSETQISDLSPITELKQLQELYCGNTQISDLSPITELKQLQKLFCQSTQISDLSPIAELKHLQELNCSETQITDLSSISELKQLEKLYCWNTQISDLSPITELKQLQKLFCQSTQITDLSSISELKQLKELYCWNTQISDLSPIAELKQLQELYCGNTQISDLGPISTLNQLQELHCSNTQISDLSPITALKQLQELSCHSTQIRDLHPISAIKQLQKLYCGNTQVHDLSPLTELNQLQELYCHSTQISDLSAISALKQLQELSCAHTQVSDIASIAALSNLTHLNISQTEVTDLTPLKSMIASDQLAVKWEDIVNAEDAPGLFVKGCPLDKTLIAAIKAGKEAVLDYFEKPKERLWEARVLILGEPRAGKTTLRRKLGKIDADLPARTESTRGIEVQIEKLYCNLPIEGKEQKVKYHLWDFGGQDMYRLLHQLFISEQAVYIIVVNTDTNDNIEEASFWLETIERLSKDKNGRYGPVLLLQNAQNNRSGRSFQELRRRFQEVWQQPEDIVINLGAISRKSELFKRTERDKFTEFKKHLESQFTKLDRLGQEMPRAWVSVRRKLEAKAKERNWIPIEDYWDICQKENIRKRQEQHDILKIFHTLGLILHYPESDVLRGMIILNREWATDALYRVLDSGLVTQNEGWFKRTDARLIWHEDKYAGRENDLLEIMQQFKLCYLHAASDRYIVPSKLPEYPDNLPDWDNQANTRLQLRYDWLPKAIPIQLMVSLHDHLVILPDNRQWIWQKGAVIDGRHLELPDTQLQLIDKGREKQMIEINVRGNQSNKLVNLVMQAWRPVHKPFEDKISVETFILCNCSQCISAARPFEFRYDQVLKAIKLQKPLYCNEALVEISPKKLLNDVFDDVTIKADAIGPRTPLIEEIVNNKIGEALDKLEDNNLTFKIRGRYRQLKRDIAAGVLSQEERIRQENELRSQLIDYVSDLYKRTQRGSEWYQSPKEKTEDANRYERTKISSKGQQGLRGKKTLVSMRELFAEVNSYNIHNYAGGQVNIQPNMVIPYNPDWGISQTDFGILTDELQRLTPEQKEEAEQLLATDVPITEAQKPSLGDKVIAFLNEHSIPVVQNLMASSYYDIMKLFLGA